MCVSKRRRLAGFTLLELLIVLTIMLIAAMIGYPALVNTLKRTQLEGAAQQVGAALRLGRLEAIRSSAPTVATLDAATKMVIVFVDQNKADGTPGNDFRYNPETVPAQVPPLPKDFEVTTVRLTPKISLGGPSGDSATVVGTTKYGVGPLLAFNPDGSALDMGGFRINDGNLNFLEVRVEPANTGRIWLRKWRTSDGAWYRRDMQSGKSLWEWY